MKPNVKPVGFEGFTPQRLELWKQVLAEPRENDLSFNTMKEIVLATGKSRSSIQRFMEKFPERVERGTRYIPSHGPVPAYRIKGGM